MDEAEGVFLDAVGAVVVRAQRVIEGGAWADVVAPRTSSQRRIDRLANQRRPSVPETKVDAIRTAATIVLANGVLLDAAVHGDAALLTAQSEEVEDLVSADGPTEALARLEPAAAELLDRCRANPAAPLSHIYPVTETASGLLGIVATELHLVARMLDRSYEPQDPRMVMRVLNGSMASMVGGGFINWTTERYKPWRNMVVRRGLAWP